MSALAVIDGPIPGFGFEIHDGYQDALSQTKLLVSSGHLSERDFEAIASATTVQDVFLAFQTALAESKHSRKTRDSQARTIFEPLVLRLERFTDAIDMLAQASPSIIGVNAIGLVWGIVKVTLIVARDVADAFDVIFEAFEDLANTLPVLNIYPEIFGTSKLQLLERPIKLLYSDMLALWTKTLTLFTQGRFKLLFRATWHSFRADFQPILKSIEKHGRFIERLGEVEHLRQTSRFQDYQREENIKAEQFRAEIRGALSSQSNQLRIGTVTRTRLFHAPIDLMTSHFIGRETELTQIRSGLDLLYPLTPSRAVIWGMPGVGKTQLALKYCMEYYTKRYTHIFRVSAATLAKIRQGIESVLDELESPERFSTEQRLKLSAVRRWFEDESHGFDRSWLIVLDNANEATVDTIRELLPKSNPRGNIVITTRSLEVAQMLSSAGGSTHFTMEIQTPDEHDAARILLANSAIDEKGSDITQSEELVKQLGCLPLAIDQAASYMRQSKISVGDMIAILETEEKSKILTWENKLSNHQERSVHAAFASSFVDLSASAPHIGNLLRLLAFFDPEGITIDVIVCGTCQLVSETEETDVKLQLIRSNYSDTRERHERGLIKRLRDRLSRVKKIVGTQSHPAPVTQDLVFEETVENVNLQAFYQSIQSPVELQTALARLQSLALLRIGGQREQKVWIHDLVQYLVQYGVTTHVERKFWVAPAVKVLSSAFSQIQDPESHEQWDRCEIYFPHVIAVAANAEKWKVTDMNLCTMLRQCALYLASRGRYADAVVMCKQALDTSETLAEPEDLELLSTVSAMAWVTYRQGQKDLAQVHAWYERVLRGRQKRLGPQHPYTLTTLNDLGFICEKEGLYAEAEKHLRMALDGREHLYGHDDEKTCLVMRNLSYLYFRQGMWKIAEDLGLRALWGEENTLGKNHAETIITVTNLSLLYEKQGRYEEAEALAMRSLQAREATLPGSHARVLMSINNLAFIYEKQGKYAEAEPLYLKTLDGRTKAMGPNHCRTHRTLGNLGVLYLRMGRVTEALDYAEKALIGRERFHGDTHPETIMCRSQLAAVYEALGRNDEGEALCLNVATHESTLGPTHPAILAGAQVMGVILLHQGRLNESKEVLFTTLDRLKGQHGVQSADTLRTLKDLGKLWLAKGCTDEGLACFTQAALEAGKCLGAGHPDTVAYETLRDGVLKDVFGK